MPVARVTNIVNTLNELKQNNVWIVGTDVNAQKAFYDSDFTGAITIVVGNEGKGIRRLVKETCDFLVTIPMKGKVASLNASVAGGLVMYEVLRQRRTKS